MQNNKINLLKVIKLGIKVCYYFITNKTATKQDIAESYNQVSQKYQETYLATMHIYNEQILNQLIKDIPEGYILDLAGGTGFNSVYLKDNNKDYQIDLVDISQDMLNQCTRKDINLICDSMIHYLSQQEVNKYDGIICTWALMYEKPQNVIKECYRVLKKGGYLYILVNDKATLPQVRKVYPYLLMKYERDVHKLMLDLPTPKDKSMLLKWGETNGFQCVSIEDNKQDFKFDSFKEATKFVTSTGALAGYDVMLDIKRQDILSMFTQLLEKSESHPCITHHFIITVFKKEL